MTVEDTVEIMDKLTGAYPRFYANVPDDVIDNAMDVWAAVFANDDPRLVIAAICSFIEGDEKGFPPVPGQIKAKMRLMTEQDRMSEMEAWALVAKAVKNSGYEARAEFEKLPPVIRRIVHDPGQLHEWAMMDSGTLHSVVASNFQRSYRRISAKEEEYDKLPSDVKTLVRKLAEAKTMPELPVEKPQESSQSAFVTRKEAKVITERLQDLAKKIKNPDSPPANRESDVGSVSPPSFRSREEIIALLRGEKD